MSTRHLKAVQDGDGPSLRRERLKLEDLADRVSRVMMELNELVELIPYPDVPVDLSSEDYKIREAMVSLRDVFRNVASAEHVISQDLPMTRAGGKGPGVALRPYEIVSRHQASQLDPGLRTITYRALMRGLGVEEWQSQLELARMQRIVMEREAREAFAKVSCEYCRAQPGEECMTKGGYVAFPAHAARRKALQALA